MKRAWIAILFFSLLYPLSAAEVIHVPRELAYPGEDILIVAGSNQLNVFSRMELYARTSGTTGYILVPMFGSGRKYSARIPAHLVRDPGVEYYILAYDTKNNVTSFPSNQPDKNPLKIRIDRTQAKDLIEFISPKRGSSTNNPRPNITISLSRIGQNIDPATIKLVLDGNDVSGSLKYSGGYANLKPPVDLAAGKHELSLQVRMKTSNELIESKSEFTITETDEETKSEKWDTETSLSGNYQYSKTVSSETPSQVTNPNGYATASLSYKATRNDEELAIGPLNYTTQELENQQIAQSFSFSYSNSRFETKWGNISASLNQLGGGGSIAGGEIVAYSHKKDEKKGYRVQVDAGRTVMPVEGSEENDGVGTYAQRMYATKLDYYLSKNTEVSGSLMDVRDVADSIDNSGPTEPLDNQAFALGFQHGAKIGFLDSLNGELGLSRAKLYLDQEQSTREYLDYAFTLSTQKKVDSIKSNFNLSYNEYRPEFLFLYGGAGSDQRSVNFGGNSNMFASTTNLNYGYNWSMDNLNNQKDTRTVSHGVNTGVGLNFKGWPSTNLSDSVTYQTTRGIPESESDNINNAVSLSLSHSLKTGGIGHNLSLSLSQNDSLNKTPTSSQTSRAQTLSSSYSPVDFLTKFSPSFSYSLSKSTSSESPEANYSDSYALSSTLPVYKDKVTLPLSLSLSRSWNTADPQTTDNQSYSASTSLSFKAGPGNLSLNTSYTAYRDSISSASNYDQYNVGLSYNAVF